MSTNADYKYANAVKEYEKANTDEEKLKALKLMLAYAPKHKGAQNLLSDIKNRIAKYRKLVEREKKQKKKTSALSIKKEGAATICIIGTTNSGKSTLLNQLTNAKVLISPIPFTTKKPEIGTMDYNGVKIQIIEIPAIVENYLDTSNGPMNLGIIRLADLLILTGNINLVKKEMLKADIKKDYLVYTGQEIKYKIWNKLGLIKVYTKEPGKKPRYPPFALKKNSTIENAAKEIHQDFIKKFKYARIWGKSAKFDGQIVGLNHKLEDNDIIEFHIK